MAFYLVHATAKGKKDEGERFSTLKGDDAPFRVAMAECYTRLGQKMPDDGLQVLMFTHKDTDVWEDLDLIRNSCSRPSISKLAASRKSALFRTLTAPMASPITKRCLARSKPTKPAPSSLLNSLAPTSRVGTTCPPTSATSSPIVSRATFITLSNCSAAAQNPTAP